MIWIIIALLAAASVGLGFMLTQSKAKLEAERAEKAAAIARAEREREELIAEHDRALDRHQRHTTQRLDGAHLPLVRDLLEGIDALQMAIDNADHEATTKRDLRDGIAMAHASITRALAKHDVTPISPEPRSTQFDPALHEAIGVIEDDELPEKTVAAMLRTGWHHPSKTLRPAMVQTSRTTPAKASSTQDDEPTTLDFSEPAEREEPVEIPARHTHT